MPVPDLTPYVDLTLDDRTAQDLFDGFLADALSRAPEWDPRETSPAVIIAESILVACAELIFALNRLPGATLEALGRRGYQLARDTGAPAVATMSFIVADTAGHVLPAGTRIAIVQADGSIVTFTTDVDADVAAGNDTGVVAITADDVGAGVNGIPAGTAIQIIDAIVFLDEASLATPLAGGRDAEDSEAYLTRLAARLQRQTIAITVPSQARFAALDVAGVGRALAIDRYDPAVGPAGTNLGHMALVLADATGAPVTADVAAAVTAELTPLMQGGLALHLIDPTTTAVAVTVTVHRDDTLSDAAAIAAVEAALTAYLNPATWPFASTVFRSELEYVIRAVPGIDRVVVLTVPAADEALPGDGPLATAGALAVVVESG